MGYGVLIIEDEAILAKNIKLFLGRVGYDVKIAETAEDGIAQLEVFKPEAILLDFNLPGMSGLECLETVRAIDSTIKVMIITGHGNVELAVNAMKAISGTIARLDEIASTVAVAVEQQGAVTQDIARSASAVAQGTREVAENVSQGSEAAAEIDQVAGAVSNAAGELSLRSDMLAKAVNQFLMQVRAA